MTRVATRCFAATALLSAMALSAAAFAGDMPSDKFKKMDTNGDGRMSAAEHEAGAREMFMMMDANKDGSVTAAEMEASHKMMMQDHSKMKDHSHMKDMKNHSKMDDTKGGN